MRKQVDTLELLYRTTFRILVLKNADARADHEQVLSIAIDQNLVGSGHDLPEALEKLKGTVWESFKDEWAEVLPSYRPDPEPEYDRAFRDWTVASVGEDPILGRLLLLLEVFAVPARPAGRRPVAVKPKMVYEEACVVG